MKVVGVGIETRYRSDQLDYRTPHLLLPYADPVNVDILQNSDNPLGDLLRDGLLRADEFRAASAFLNSGGLECVMPGIRRILEGEGTVSVVHGADFRISDPAAVKRLVELNERFAKMTYRVLLGWDLTQSHRFHPKMYMWTADYDTYAVAVGSSNLTRGGLFDNTEVNTVILGSRAQIPIESCINIFDRIITHPDLVEPNSQFVEMYGELYERAPEFPIGRHPPDDLRELYEELANLFTPPATNWQPRNQQELVIKVLQHRETRSSKPDHLQDAEDQFVRLEDIYSEAEQLARAIGMSFKWGTFKNSLRRAVYSDVPKGGLVGSYFVRESVGSGRYRLSAAGRSFVPESLRDPQ